MLKTLWFDSKQNLVKGMSLSNELYFDSMMATMLVETPPGKGHFLIKLALRWISKVLGKHDSLSNKLCFHAIHNLVKGSSFSNGL